MASNCSRWAFAGTAALLLASPAFLPARSDAGSDGGWSGPPAHSGDGAERASETLNGYVEGYNTLVGTFGLSQQFQQYLGQRIPQKGLNDPVFINVGWIGNGLDLLKKARAIGGGPVELDQAADPLIVTLVSLVGRLNGLAAYYRSRGQLVDKFALGKREDPLVVADFKLALAQLAVLSAAIDHQQDLRDQRQLAVLKASGDKVAYDTTLALQKSKRLLRLFNSRADLGEKTKLEVADGLAGQIQAALADEQVAKAAGSSKGISDSMDDSAVEALETLLGHYRDLRASGNPFNYQLMVYSYNNAVEQHNHGQL